MNARLLLLVCVTAGCGRLRFEIHDDAAIPRCDPSAPFTSVIDLATLSSADGDGGMRLSQDELVAYFHSDRPPLVGGYGLFTAVRGSRSDPFGAPVPLQIGGFFPSLSADQLTLAYDAIGEIYTATRANPTDAFPAATLFAEINTPAYDANPFFGGGGTRIYFSNDTQGSFDLFVAAWPPPSTRSALTEINTPGTETSPVISADELTLYYTLEAGGRPPEVWTARRTRADLPFEPPTRVDEVTGVDATGPTWLSPDHCRLYFESTRMGPDYDLYLAERAP